MRFKKVIKVNPACPPKYLPLHKWQLRMKELALQNERRERTKKAEKKLAWLTSCCHQIVGIEFFFTPYTFFQKQENDSTEIIECAYRDCYKCKLYGEMVEKKEGQSWQKILKPQFLL